MVKSGTQAKPRCCKTGDTAATDHSAACGTGSPHFPALWTEILLHAAVQNAKPMAIQEIHAYILINIPT